MKGNIDLKEFKKQTFICSDNDSQVFQIEEIKTGNIFAAKIFTYSKDESFHLLTKLNSASQLFHPSLAKFKGFSPTNFDEDSQPVITTEYISEIALSHIIRRSKEYLNTSNWDDTKKLINLYGISSALLYLNEHDITNIELTPENIFETTGFHPKIINFVLSKNLINNDQTMPSNEASYQKENSSFNDVYSFGIIAYFIMTNEYPFEDEKLNNFQIHQRIKEGKFPSLKKSIGEAYQQLIYDCLSSDLMKQPTIKEIVKRLETDSNFLTENVNEYEFNQYVCIVKSSVKKEEEEEEKGEEEESIYINNMKNHLISLNVPIIDVNRFVKQDKIRAGNFSKLYIIKDKKTNEMFAAKIVRNETESSYFLPEVTIHSQTNHPAIIKLIGCSSVDFKNRNRPMIIMEYANNASLFHILELEKEGKAIPIFNDTKKLIIVYGIASAMKYLHSINILHGDLKPGNILIDDFLFPKICDFGSSRFISEKNHCSKPFGTLPYIAPEIWSQSEYSKKVDVYSFALIVYEIFSQKAPFQDINITKVMYHSSVLKKRPDFTKTVPKVYRELISKCWDQDPEKRPSFEYIVNDLKTNPGYLTEGVNESIYRSYIDFIDQQMNGQKIDEQFPKYQLEQYYKSYLDSLPPIGLNFEYINLLNLSEYEKIKPIIGYGSYGKVFKIKEKSTMKIYAAKQLNIIPSIANRRKQLTIKREVDILSKIMHPCIMKLIGYSPVNFEDKEKLLIITEYVKNGSLDQILQIERNEGCISFWNDTMRLINIYGIASAMSYLHSRNIIHRDIKPVNILVDEYLFPKVCDFGFSKFLSVDESMNNHQVDSDDKGTPRYAAPEIYNGDKHTTAVDVYSFAILVYEIMTITIAFEGKTDFNIMNIVAIEERRPEFTKEIPNAYKNLIEKCWNQNPEERLTFDMIVKDLKTNPNYITENVDANLFHAYINIIESQQKGIDTSEIQNTMFTKHSVDALFKDYEKKLKNLSKSFSNLDKFEKKEQYQEGEISNVYKVIESKSGLTFSATISKYSEKWTGKEIEKTAEEIKKLSRIKHQSIQKFVGFSIHDFKGRERPVTIKEYCSNLTLLDILTNKNKIQSDPKWNSTNKLIIIYGIASGMSYLYKHDIEHEDLNPRNVLIDEKFHPKITEIGHYTLPQNLRNALSRSSIHINKTHIYFSPEIFRGESRTEKSEVYSFGKIIYEIITNKIDMKNTNKFFSNHLSTFDDESIPIIYKQLIEKCCSKDPQERPSFLDIVFQLSNDNKFIIEDINIEIYNNYIKSIQ